MNCSRAIFFFFVVVVFFKGPQSLRMRHLEFGSSPLHGLNPLHDALNTNKNEIKREHFDLDVYFIDLICNAYFQYTVSHDVIDCKM